MSFDDVRTKSTAELESLLSRGSPPDRLWAAWTLALRSSERTEAIDHFEHEPHEGVRAHLVYVVADPTRLPLLRTIAEHDPSLLVRVAACRAVTRVSAPGDAQWIASRALDPSPEVRVTIVEELARDSPSLRAILTRAHDDDAEAVRIVAARRCVDLEIDIDDLHARRDDRHVRAAIEDALFERYGSEAILHTRLPGLRVLLLRRAVEARRPIPATVIRQLFDDMPPGATEAIAKAEVLGLASLSLSNWLSLYERADRWAVARSVVIERLPQAIAASTTEDHRSLGERLEAVARDIDEALANAAAQAQEEDLDEPWYDEPPDVWLRARDAIRGRTPS